MLHSVEDFYNKAAKAIREKYFPTVKYYRDDKDCEAASYSLERFNNGCLTYTKLINQLAKSCKATKPEVHAVIEKFIVSFGSFKYRPR